MLKLSVVVACVVGLAAFIATLAWSGVGAVALAVASVGFGTVLVVLRHAATVAIAGASWWLLFPPKERPSLATTIHLRLVREGANVLLPVAQVGGDLIGARLLAMRGVPGALAVASVVVDVMIQAVTQFLFAMLGLAILVGLGVDTKVAATAALGLAVAAPLLGGFVVAQGRGGRRLIERILGFLADEIKLRALASVDAVYQCLTMLYARRGALLAASLVHMAEWLVGILDVLIVFAFLGHPVGIAEAIVIESLAHAIRGAAFMIPGALGAQEAGLIVICAIFGIPADQAMALSLVKRVADLAVGLPGLASWQIMEARQLAARYRRRAP